MHVYLYSIYTYLVPYYTPSPYTPCHNSLITKPSNLPLYNTLHFSTAELSAALKEAEECRDALDRFKDIVKDEIIATKETYFAIHSHCYETEVCVNGS